MAIKKKGKKTKKAENKARKVAKKAAKLDAKKARLAKSQRAKKAVAAKPKARATVKPAAKGARKTSRQLARRNPPARVHQARQKPESLRLRSAGPSFTVNDVEKSLAFYRDVLGFTVRQRWEQDGTLHGVEIVAGSVSFWLGQDDWKKGRDRVKGQGFRVYCGTTQDIDGLAQRVRAGGGTLVEEPKDQPWGGRDFAVADPDGFTITFSSGL